MKASPVSFSAVLLAGVNALLTLGSSPFSTAVSAFQAPLLSRSYSSSVLSPVQSFRSFSEPQSALLFRQNKHFSKASAPSTQLGMAYNLPPGGGGPKDDNVISQVLGGALTIGAIVLFFISPLGSIFFAITNSLFILALLTPVLLTIAFKVWQSLNTVTGSCPSCGAPNQVVLKENGQVSFCLNCGAFLQASSDQKTIELANNPARRGNNDFIDMDSGSPMGGGGSIFDSFFGGGPGADRPEQPTQSAVRDKEQKFKREQTVIDVEVDKD